MTASDTEKPESTPTAGPAVHTYNEWGCLREVIVGRIEQAALAPDEPSVHAVVPKALQARLPQIGGQRVPPALIEAANVELEAFIEILEREGVEVRRPDVYDHHQAYATPFWESRGLSTACPRDGILVVGDTIIETPMAWRSRFFEMYPYRRLFREYFDKGARWLSAPKPMLLDSLYDESFEAPAPDGPMRYVINESEIVFDAADFARCGRDIFCQVSNVTNRAGIAWLQRQLGPDYRVHTLDTSCWRRPMHIDASFVPLAPRRVLINPHDIDVSTLPPMFDDWEIIVAPNPDPTPGTAFESLRMCSDWLSVNVLSLDENRVMVESGQVSLAATLRSHGFEVITCDFEHYAAFGGGFHCATVDIRRDGGLESYT